MSVNIDKASVFKTFSELVNIDSLSFQEKLAATYVKNKLKQFNIKAEEDDVGEILKNESERKELVSGNLYAYVPGTIKGKPIIISSHLDTVSPGLNKKAILGEDGIIRSDGTTVLGADDEAAVAAILELIKVLKSQNIPHRDLELVFSVGEEAYDRGIREFNFKKLKGNEVYVVDMGGKVGRAAVAAPTLISFQVHIIGRAAHAGSEPEKGIHSIKIASEAISVLRLGKLDEESTRNIGIFQSGSGTNIIPEEAVIKGEVRSRSHQKALDFLEETKQVFERAANKYGATVDFSSQIRLVAYQTPLNAPVVERFKRAANALKLPVEFLKTFGGSDNNYYSANGISGIVISRGGEEAHSTRESIRLDDIALTTELLLKLVTDSN